MTQIMGDIKRIDSDIFFPFGEDRLGKKLKEFYHSGDYRNFGKLISPFSEDLVASALSSLSLSVENPKYPNKNEKGYDKLVEGMRVQIKFRSKSDHFENTRRGSQGKVDSQKSGHEVYSIDEFDVLILLKMSNITDEGIHMYMVAIPVGALVSKKNPKILINNIPKSLVDTYRTISVLSQFNKEQKL